MSKEGLIAAKELNRLRSDPFRLDRFMRSHVSRLLKSDLVSVLVELQRQDQVFLSMKVRQISLSVFFLVVTKVVEEKKKIRKLGAGERNFATIRDIWI